MAIEQFSAVYAHVNNITKQVYIGIAKNPYLRWGNNGDGYRNSKFYDEGINYYGWDNFEHIILIPENSITTEEAEQIEARLIRSCNSKNLGYNDSNGAVIYKNEALDKVAIIAKSKIDNYISSISLTKNTIDWGSFSTGYDYSSTSYPISVLLDYWNNNRINTKLDVQRIYTWDEKREQEMWDTLLHGHIIPELHAIVNDDTLDIIDGKQRITCIMNILKNNIKLQWKTVKNDKYFKHLFDDTLNKTLGFSELPKILQQKILNKELQIYKYKNVNTESKCLIFKKLNNGDQLSQFGKEIAHNILVRHEYTGKLLLHPFIKAYFNCDDGANGERNELNLARLLVLIYRNRIVSLTPNSLGVHLSEISTDINFLREAYNKTAKKFDEFDINQLDLWKKYKRRANLFSPIMYLYYNNYIDCYQIGQIPKILQEQPSLIPPARGSDLNNNTLTKYFKAFSGIFDIKDIGVLGK